MLGTIRRDVPFSGALEQIVRRLRRVQRCYRAKFVHLRGIEVADADRPDFSRAMEIGHGSGRLRDRCGRVGPVHLVEVDHVGLQTLQ
jgi:hypothetical protein